MSIQDIQNIDDMVTKIIVFVDTPALLFENINNIHDAKIREQIESDIFKNLIEINSEFLKGYKRELEHLRGLYTSLFRQNRNNYQQVDAKISEGIAKYEKLISLIKSHRHQRSSHNGGTRRRKSKKSQRGKSKKNQRR
jgi:hypothetical protein